MGIWPMKPHRVKVSITQRHSVLKYVTSILETYFCFYLCLHVCLSVSMHTCAEVSREGTGSPRTGVGVHLCGCWDLNAEGDVCPANCWAISPALKLSLFMQLIILSKAQVFHALWRQCVEVSLIAWKLVLKGYPGRNPPGPAVHAQKICVSVTNL